MQLGINVREHVSITFCSHVSRTLQVRGDVLAQLLLARVELVDEELKGNRQDQEDQNLEEIALLH